MKKFALAATAFVVLASLFTFAPPLGMRAATTITNDAELISLLNQDTTRYNETITITNNITINASELQGVVSRITFNNCAVNGSYNNSGTRITIIVNNDTYSPIRQLFLRFIDGGGISNINFVFNGDVNTCPVFYETLLQSAGWNTKMVMRDINVIINGNVITGSNRPMDSWVSSSSATAFAGKTDCTIIDNVDIYVSGMIGSTIPQSTATYASPLAYVASRTEISNVSVQVDSGIFAYTSNGPASAAGLVNIHYTYPVGYGGDTDVKVQNNSVTIGTENAPTVIEAVVLGNNESSYDSHSSGLIGHIEYMDWEGIYAWQISLINNSVKVYGDIIKNTTAATTGLTRTQATGIASLSATKPAGKTFAVNNNVVEVTGTIGAYGAKNTVIVAGGIIAMSAVAGEASGNIIDVGGIVAAEIEFGPTTPRDVYAYGFIYQSPYNIACHDNVVIVRGDIIAVNQVNSNTNYAIAAGFGHFGGNDNKVTVEGSIISESQGYAISAGFSFNIRSDQDTNQVDIFGSVSAGDNSIGDALTGAVSMRASVAYSSGYATQINVPAGGNSFVVSGISSYVKGDILSIGNQAFAAGIANDIYTNNPASGVSMDQVIFRSDGTVRATSLSSNPAHGAYAGGFGSRIYNGVLVKNSAVYVKDGVSAVAEFGADRAAGGFAAYTGHDHNSPATLENCTILLEDAADVSFVEYHEGIDNDCYVVIIAGTSRTAYLLSHDSAMRIAPAVLPKAGIKEIVNSVEFEEYGFDNLDALATLNALLIDLAGVRELDDLEDLFDDLADLLGDVDTISKLAAILPFVDELLEEIYAVVAELDAGGSLVTMPELDALISLVELLKSLRTLAVLANMDPMIEYVLDLEEASALKLASVQAYSWSTNTLVGTVSIKNHDHPVGGDFDYILSADAGINLNQLATYDYVNEYYTLDTGSIPAEVKTDLPVTPHGAIICADNAVIYDIIGIRGIDTVVVPPTYRVSVVNSFASPNGSGEYLEGVLVTISAGTNPGHTFNGWTVSSGGVSLGNTGSASTTFSMPPSDVTVTANWTADPPPTSTPTVTRPTIIPTSFTPTPTTTPTTTTSSTTPTTPTTTTSSTTPTTTTSSTTTTSVTTTTSSATTTTSSTPTTTSTTTTSFTTPTTLPPEPGDDEQAWALLNLILCVLGALLAVVMTIWAFVNANTKQIRYLWLFVVMVLGTAGVMLFFMTEDMNSPMGLADMWTIVNGAILLAEVLCVMLLLGGKSKEAR